MTPILQIAHYLDENPDLKDGFQGADPAKIIEHYVDHGFKELRGLRVSEYCNIEAVMISDQGDVCIIGWFDRRMVSPEKFSVMMGYHRYTISDATLAWYHRGDVSMVTGDRAQESGMVLFGRIHGLLPRPQHIRLLVNNVQVYAQASIRLKSPAAFLDETLSALTVLSDRPAGETFSQALTLQPALEAVWRRHLSTMTYLPIFESGAHYTPRSSVVITLYRSASYLIPQMTLLASALRLAQAEVIVVLNEVGDREPLVQRLVSFCNSQKLVLRVWSCSDNSGFSAANNFGASQARSETLIFMNPDIFPAPEVPVEDYAAFLSEHEGDDIVGAPLYYSDGLLMHSGMYVVQETLTDSRYERSHQVLRVEHLGKGLPSRIGGNDRPWAEVDGVKGVLMSAALLKISKARFESLNGLSTDYIIAYYEDADFCLRHLEAGGRIRLEDGSRWYHHEGVGRNSSPRTRAFTWLNRAKFSRQFETSAYIADLSTDLEVL